MNLLTGLDDIQFTFDELILLRSFDDEQWIFYTY